MRKVLGAALVVAGMAVIPASAFAQQHGGMGGGGMRPDHEFGVDLTAFYAHAGSPCSTNCGTFNVGTPVDVRVGFVSDGPLMFEPRLALAWVTGGGGHILALLPGLNVLYKWGPGSGHHNMMGMYLTAGATLSYTDVGFGTTSTSTTQFAINGGVGKRIAYGSGAFRPEAFFRYNFSNTSKGIPSSWDLGLRLGLSLWH